MAFLGLIPLLLFFVSTPRLSRATGSGSISLPSFGITVSENFDTLASSGTSTSLPNGWYFEETGTSANITYTAGTGSSNVGDTYSFGITGTNPFTDRALGTLQSNTLVPAIGAKFFNNTGGIITSLIITYTGEEWRLGSSSRTDQLDFQLSTNAITLTSPSATWMDYDNLDFITPNTTTNGANDGNAASNRTVISNTITGLSIAAGAPFWIRWTDFNASGSDDGLAIDDFSITPFGVYDIPPTIASVSPISGSLNVAINANIVITFSEPVTVTGAWFNISCSISAGHTATVSGGATTFSLAPASAYANNEVCTVTVYAAQVTDQDMTIDNLGANYVWAFTTAPPTPVSYRIHDVQGASHISPVSGTLVALYPAIVTAKVSSGFYLEEMDINWDSDDKTSEGIFVYTASAPSVSIGDNVSVTGLAAEYRAGSSSLTKTEIDVTVNGGAVAVNTTGNTLPTSIIIGAGGRVPPTTIFENDTTCTVLDSASCNNTFDPGEDGVDFFESLESMLVQINNAVAVGPTKNSEVVVLADNGGNGAGNRTARGGIIVRATDNNPERLVLASSIIVGSVPNVHVGATFVPTQPIIAVVDYDYDSYKLQVTAKPIVATNSLTQESTATPSANQLAVATFNVQNLSPSDSASKYSALASIVINNLKSPDLLVVEEVQDNSGVTNDGTVNADVTIGKLTIAITNAGGPIYQYRQINPVNNADGGVTGGNIRVVLLYRTDRGLSFVDRACACDLSTTPVTATLSGGVAQLSHSPGRIDPGNSAWSTPAPSRKPLAGEFLFNGNRIFVIGNHWKSKSGDDPLFGRYQPPTQYTQIDQRNAQAAVVRGFIDSLLALDSNAKIIAAGDFNDFEFSAPLVTLKGSNMHALVEDLPANERYSYVFDGNSQTLDHILISNALYNSAVPQFDIVHVNSEFYNQVSDHDPSIVRLSFTKIFLPLVVR